MSTFMGIVKEFQNISIDRFELKNLESKIFLLSHCHQDHMVGLDNPQFNGPLYTSQVSKLLIKYHFPHISNIQSLEIGVPSIIEYSNNNTKEQIVVTLIPALHCPGSVMFMIENHNFRILYTGDFRMQLKYLKSICAFKSNDEVLKIDSVYLDSTFFDEEYMNFPSQFESTAEICKLIENWVKRGQQYNILIKTPARYGSEFLFIEISKLLKMKIHVNSSELKKYKHFAEMDNCFVEDPTNIQIHACVVNSDKNYKFLGCNNLVNSKFLRVIRPSALIWKNWKIRTDFITKGSTEIYRVCYSNHSSYTELKDMILYLKPQNIELNVIPENKTKREKMLKTLQDLQLEYKTDVATIQPCSSYAVFKQSDYSLNKVVLSVNAMREEDGDSDEEIIDIPKRRKL